MSVPHHDGLFVDRVDDYLDEEIDGRTEDFIWWQEGQPSGGAEVDIILSQLKCGFWFRKVLDPTKSRMKVVLSVSVGVSGVLCHLDSSNDTTGHDDGYFGLNVGHVYPVCANGMTDLLDKCPVKETFLPDISRFYWTLSHRILWSIKTSVPSP